MFTADDMFEMISWTSNWVEINNGNYLNDKLFESNIPFRALDGYCLSTGGKKTCYCASDRCNSVSFYLLPFNFSQLMIIVIILHYIVNDCVLI